AGRRGPRPVLRRRRRFHRRARHDREGDAEPDRVGRGAPVTGSDSAGASGASGAADAVARHTGSEPVDTRPLGGDAVAARLDARDGPHGRAGTVVAKRGAGRNAAAAEGAGLRWLAEPGVVPVPHVHGWDDAWLVLASVEPGRPTPEGAEAFGRGLAALH